MPQGPLNACIARNPANALASALLDAVNLLLTSSGGDTPMYDLTAAKVIKASPGRLARIIILVGGTTSDGSFVFNDTTTTGGASASNEIISIPAGTPAGTIYAIDWLCESGIVLSAVPTAGSPICAVAFA